MNLDSLTFELSHYEELFPRDVDNVRRMRDLIAGSTDPLSRSQYEPGHLTASACVLSIDARHVLLVHHRKLDLWVQPGGHLEPTDQSLLEAARREAIEECGIEPLDALDPAFPTDIDIHEVPAHGAEPAHLHYDLRYAFRALQHAKPYKSSESHDVHWVPIDELSGYTHEIGLYRLVERALLRSSGTH